MKYLETMAASARLSGLDARSSNWIQIHLCLQMPSGTVKWFNIERGFGFIGPDDGGKDVFVHISAVQRAGMEYLREGAKVTFDIVDNRGKPVSDNLRLK